MAWREDDFGGSGGQGYRSPSMDEVVLTIQQKMARWGGKRILFSIKEKEGKKE